MLFADRMRGTGVFPALSWGREYLAILHYVATSLQASFSWNLNKPL
jgi:hypothetical protein